MVYRGAATGHATKWPLVRNCVVELLCRLVVIAFLCSLIKQSVIVMLQLLSDVDEQQDVLGDGVLSVEVKVVH